MGIIQFKKTKELIKLKYMSKDLFEQPSKLPKKIQAILRQYNDLEMERGIQYADLIRMGKEMAENGYSFDFYLDCVPYNLQKINN